MEFAKRFWRDQQGTVESTLVIIPLMALFLIAVELIVAVNYRNIDMTFAQSAASTRAITSEVSNTDEIISFSSPQSFDELRLIIAHHQRNLPRLIPNLPFLSGAEDRSTDVTGVAVMERQP